MTDEDQEKQNTEQAVDAEANAETQESQVADKDGAAQAANERSMDEILKEFEGREERQETRQDQQPRSSEQQQQQTQQTYSAVDQGKLAEIEASLDALARKSAKADLERAVSAVKGESDASPRVVEAWIDAAARDDPRISKAWHQRHDNPKVWAQVEAALARDFRKEFGVKVDKQVTESRDAVASAVRGSSSAAAKDSEFPDAKGVWGMSQDEFNDLQRKMGVSPV